MAPVDPPDLRPIDEIEFALDEKNPEARQLTQEVIRKILKAAGAGSADDVITLGCTGLFGQGVSLKDAIFVRENMGGAKFSLPCYVSPDRYCLIHDTIGGLQTDKKQQPMYPEFVEKVSRELTPEENKHVGLVENARRVKAREGINKKENAREILNSGELPQPGEPTLMQTAFPQEQVAEPFKCPEHVKLLWRCRFCVAAEIANGELIPSFLMAPTAVENNLLVEDLAEVDPDEINDRVQKYDEMGADASAVFVKVAVWRRKLARD